MSKASKNLNKWKRTIPKEVQWIEVKAVLELFRIDYTEKKGSHISAHHTAMEGHPSYPDGRWHIPRRGTKVLGRYLKELVVVILPIIYEYEGREND